MITMERKILLHGDAATKIKPILFNTEMVRAILESHKTATRRVVKPQPVMDTDRIWHWKDCQWMDGGLGFPASGIKDYAPYQTGDILYVRETWAKDESGEFVYRTNYGSTEDDSFPPSMFKWRPSIHMPREAARIFLRVTDVRVERLQIIDDEGAKAEGANWRNGKNAGWQEKMCRSAIDRFAEIWDSTIKKVDLALYGWEANPWVWVITFEKLVKGERHE